MDRTVIRGTIRHLCPYAGILLAAFFLGGCSTYHFNTSEFSPAFPRLETPIARKVALAVPEETRTFNFSFANKRWAVGEAVESHVLSGLKAAFSDAVAVSGSALPPGFDRLATCSLGKKSNLTIGYVWSDKVATIELSCHIQDASGTPLWNGAVSRAEVFNERIVGHMLQLTALASVFIRSVDARGAEERYDAMITSGVNNSLILAVDEMMNKMVKEGAVVICSGCTGHPDWRKVVQTAPSSSLSSESP